MPKNLSVRPIDDNENISSDTLNLFQFGNEMLLFLIKQSRPDIANVTQELSKVNDGVNWWDASGNQGCT